MLRILLIALCLACSACTTAPAGREPSGAEVPYPAAPAALLAKAAVWRQALDKPEYALPPAPSEGARCRVDLGFRLGVVATRGSCMAKPGEPVGLMEGDGEVWSSYVNNVRGYLVARFVDGVPQGEQIGMTSDGQFWIADWERGKIVRLVQWFPWGHRFEGSIYNGSRDGAGTLYDAKSGTRVSGEWRIDRLLRGRIELGGQDWVEVESREGGREGRLVVTASNRDTLKPGEPLPDDIAKPLRLLPVLPGRSPIIKK